MQTEINVGDVVTYQPHADEPEVLKRVLPIGISGCRVLGFVRGKSTNRPVEEDYAKIEWTPWHNDGKPETFHAPVAWLQKE